MKRSTESLLATAITAAENDGVPQSDLIRFIRQARSEEVLFAELADASGLVPPLSDSDWDSVKEFLISPVDGEGQLGRVLTILSDSVASNNQEEFWAAVLVGVRMLRRHLRIKDQVFGKG